MTVARMTLLAGLLANPALAEGRAALIVASTAGGVPEKVVRGDALDLSESLFGMGFTVTRLENPTAAQVDAAIAGMPKTGPALFYFAGPAVVEEGENILLSGTDRVPLDGAVQRMVATGRAQTMVVVDTCHGAGPGLVMPDEGANLFVTLPNAPGVDCVADVSSLAVQLLEKVEAPGVPLADLFPTSPIPAPIDGQTPVLAPGLWVRSSLTAPFILREASPATQLSAADYRMLEKLPADERANLLALWQAAGIAVDVDRPASGTVTAVLDQTVVSPVQPLVQTASIIAPVAAVISPIVAGSEVQGEELAVLVAAPVRTSGARPVPGAGGLPRPSVILGEAATLAALDVPALDVPPAQLLDYTDITARSALKASDRAEYDRLILAGSYDPPPDQLPVAVQTELKRMGCYRGGIDGQWGPGSRRALQLYFDTLQAATTTQEPTIEVFHQLLQKDEVACPAPPVAEAAPAATTRNTTRTTTQAAPTTRRQPAAAAPAPAAPAPAATGRRIRTNSGTGAFR